MYGMCIGELVSPRHVSLVQCLVSVFGKCMQWLSQKISDTEEDLKATQRSTLKDYSIIIK